MTRVRKFRVVGVRCVSDGRQVARETVDLGHYATRGAARVACRLAVQLGCVDEARIAPLQTNEPRVSHEY